VLLATQEAEIRRIAVPGQLGQKLRPYLKNTPNTHTPLECLPSRHEALSLNSNTTREREREREIEVSFRVLYSIIHQPKYDTYLQRQSTLSLKYQQLRHISTCRSTRDNFLLVYWLGLGGFVLLSLCFRKTLQNIL
jgi:hypothetical protein